MDYYYNEYSNNNNSKFYYVKKLTQIIISLTLFSFLISQSSLAIILINYYNNYFVPIKIFTYTTERNCIFLLCNGILVLIIQTSGLVTKVTPLDQSGPKGTTTRIDERLDRETIENRLDEFQENKAKNVGIINVNVEENETEIIDSKEDYEGCGINNQESEFEDDDDEHEEEEDDDEGVDELNKKCEDFIKKMKQEIQGTPK
ncbi:hypothetical protein ABFS83_13G004500 [Erythranthe nasuta]